jgi:hypothetical protein
MLRRRKPSCLRIATPALVLATLSLALPASAVSATKTYFAGTVHCDVATFKLVGLKPASVRAARVTLGQRDAQVEPAVVRRGARRGTLRLRLSTLPWTSVVTRTHNPRTATRRHGMRGTRLAHTRPRQKQASQERNADRHHRRARREKHTSCRNTRARPAGVRRKRPKLTVITSADPAPPPPPSGFPDASNTGVPAGTTLSPYTGPSTISTAGAVIDGKSMGCITVRAPGVVIRSSKISCQGGYAVYVPDGAFTGTPLTVEDSDVDCKLTGGNGLGEANITVRRVDIQGCENGFDINQNLMIQDSYIHDLYNSGSAHTDGAQMAAGHYENGQLVAGSRNVTFLHNTIYGMGADGSFGTSAIISNRGADRDILIQNNLMAGGAVALYCEQGATGTNYRVLDNHFSTKFGSKVGYYGVSTDCSDEVQSGNVYHETGQPVRLP